jgi:hypothetical protein
MRDGAILFKALGTTLGEMRHEITKEFEARLAKL